MKQGRVVFVMMLIAIFFVLPAIALAEAAPTPVPATEHPYLGVRMEDTEAGVVVREVITASPAEAAGLQIDDVIQKINDKAVANVYEAMQAIDAMKPNDQIRLAISRAGQPQNLTATLKGVTTLFTEIVPNNVPFDAFGYKQADQSWQIFSIADASDLYTAGLRQGDIITQFNGKAYAPADLQSFIQGLADKDMVKITVQRAGKPTDVQAPAADLRALNVVGYENEGLLFRVVPVTPSTLPLIPRLPNNVPFNAITYDYANQKWMVLGLEEHGALYEAGLRMGDWVTKFDGKTYTPAAFQSYRESLGDNASVKITVERQGSAVDVNVPAADLNALDFFHTTSGSLLLGLPTTTSHVWLGADMRTLTTAFATQHQLKATEGALVIGVMPESPAANAGLEANDIIRAIGQDNVKDLAHLQELLANHKPGDKITLNVMRGSSTMNIEAILGQPEISGELPFLMSAQ
jgi:S1-C subfamily serine protease